MIIAPGSTYYKASKPDTSGDAEEEKGAEATEPKKADNDADIDISKEEIVSHYTTVGAKIIAHNDADMKD